ncbi:MAG TPA: hypothetical protein VMU57_13260 [Edaphobacter sp.]|uniref:hypothetical protein n=1 Tax=Edaphobacter sp. TaxID=1934404 RepID=UPI002CDEB76E|nr:hypothetical protein [Edaphobacter sp.]HUZ95870.1 hypothetical protein [Edaphobacter sp.]
MLPPSMIRDWASRLIASEVDADPSSAQTEIATLRVYEKLRRQLCAPVGVDGFQALASRALSLAKSQSPRLSAVQVTANGCLRGFGENEFRLDTDEDGEVGIILIAQLLGLFLTLLGEAATVRLIEGAPLQIEVKAKLDTTGRSNFATGTSYFGPFEDILLEADQLRNVSERLETLVDKHVGIEEVMSVAGNIRNIATVLDVFTLIRSKAGGSQR